MREPIPAHPSDPQPVAGSRLFEAHGTLVSGGSDKPFLLDNDAAWFICSGEVDLFSVQVEGGRAVGARTHLFRLGAGRSLFAHGPVVEPSRALLAVGTFGTRLRQAPQAALRRAARDAVDLSEVHTLVDEWVEGLCAGVAREITPKRFAELESNADTSVPSQTTARPRRRVSWVRHLEGHSLFLGREGLEVNGSGYTPLSRRAWLQVNEPIRIRVADGSTLGADELWAGLARLHTLVLAYTAVLATQSALAESLRLRRKSAGHRASMRTACAELSDAMRPARARAATGGADNDDAGDGPATGWHDALFAACRIVGGELDITMKPYARAEDAPDPRDPLASIARASRVRIRKVALRGEWWREDNGPLIGSMSENNRPLALIRVRGGYVMHDTLQRTTAAVTAQTAQGMSPFAYTLYRPFPDDVLAISDVIRIGFRGCGPDLAMVVGMGTIAAILGLVPSWATGMLFNTIIPGAQRSQLGQMTTVLLVVAMATAMFNVTRSVALLRIEGRMGSAIQAAVWDRLLALPMPFFRPYAAGDLAVRAMGIDAIRQIVSGTTVTAILGGLFSLFNFGLMFYYSPPMAWRATMLIAVAIAITGCGSWLQLSHQRGIAALQSKVSGLVLQLLSSIAKLRVAGAEVPAFTLWARQFAEQRRLQFRVRQVGNAVAAFNAAFPVLAYMVLFWTALHLVRGADATIRTGDFLAFLSAYGACQGALLATCMALLSTLNVIPLYEQAKPILVTRPEVDVGKSDPGSLSGDIEIQHVHFRYQADGAAVLRDVSLHVQPGEFVAFVGPSGSGKSTILRLLLGFEAPDSGGIYYDGQELRGVDVHAVRRQIGVVLQNGRLMSGDIFTNIIGSAPLSIEDAWEAARMAGFADDVKAMPMGMHTVITDGGGTLSGGQRQRLMIARALVHRPRLLFFDEATSALDNRTQAIVSESLHRLQATRIVVAHRLSTIVNADRIVVIDRGRITQSGTYAEMIDQPGLFAELAKRQIA
jgi:NHLM bacteriocin system ABC transporter ATP-binding protein